jgi:hypothetical protein
VKMPRLKAWIRVACFRGMNAPAPSVTTCVLPTAVLADERVKILHRRKVCRRRKDCRRRKVCRRRGGQAEEGVEYIPGTARPLDPGAGLR